MQIHECLDRGVLIVEPSGRIDSTTAPALDQRLAAMKADAYPKVVVDFTGVDYISSAGLRVMLILARRIRDSKGTLVLSGLGVAVHQVFELAGFLSLFTIERSREEAVSRLMASAAR